MCGRVVGTLFAAFVGFVGGCYTTAANTPRSGHASDAVYYPMPHHVPKNADGVSFRFAMVHDVVHERFPKHGPDFYRERNRLSREKLKFLKPDDPATFPHIDDLTAGLARLGEFDEAIRLQREKLERQNAAGLKDRELYSTYANLGTFLMIANISGLYAGDKDATARFRESVELVKYSVRVNPESHFGREQWQVVFGEFLLAAAEQPFLLHTSDFLGNRFNSEVETVIDPEQNWASEYPSGRATKREYGRIEGKIVRETLLGMKDLSSFPPEFRTEVRSFIMPVGAEGNWPATPYHTKPVPFDEPVLGIIGMWRQGGGANPHFALALAETMLRTGQRNIAWSAYERTARLADGYFGDAKTNDFLRNHCRQRQAAIESTWRGKWLNRSRRDELVLNDEEIAAVQTRFDAELAFGLAYQKAYQDYESERIRAGANIDGGHFFDAFNAERSSIASPSGPEELFASGTNIIDHFYRAFAWGCFSAGLAVVLANGLRRLIWRRRYPSPPPPG